MTPQPEGPARAWLSDTRKRLADFPLSVPGPDGQPVAVAFVTDHQGSYAVLSGFVEQDRQLRPIEVELTAGCVVPLDLVRIYYDA